MNGQMPLWLISLLKWRSTITFSNSHLMNGESFGLRNHLLTKLKPHGIKTTRVKKPKSESPKLPTPKNIQPSGHTGSKLVFSRLTKQLTSLKPSSNQKLIMLLSTMVPITTKQSYWTSKTTPLLRTSLIKSPSLGLKRISTMSLIFWAEH